MEMSETTIYADILGKLLILGRSRGTPIHETNKIPCKMMRAPEV